VDALIFGTCLLASIMQLLLISCPGIARLADCSGVGMGRLNAVNCCLRQLLA